jgi:hypothetical protein
MSTIEKLASPSAGQLAMRSREDLPPEITIGHRLIRTQLRR